MQDGACADVIYSVLRIWDREPAVEQIPFHPQQEGRHKRARYSLEELAVGDAFGEHFSGWPKQVCPASRRFCFPVMYENPIREGFSSSKPRHDDRRE